MKIRRRNVLRASGAALATGVSLAGAGACRKAAPAPQRGDARFIGQSPDRGHRLRARAHWGASAVSTEKVGTLIVGAGAAGCAAAYALAAAGDRDFVVLELEDALGGTARGGTWPSGRHPMGAHYLPAPGPDCPELVDLLDDLGLVLERDASGRSTRCSDGSEPAPTERHYYRGVWDEGLYPARGETPAEADDWARFADHLRELDDRRDGDGHRMFRLPLRRGSAELRHLDRISMADYLDQLGIGSWRTRWVIDYACRDDYGTRIEDTSAYAGLHHFLARGLEERRDAYILTFPEGNARLVEGMANKAGLEDDERLRLAHLVVELDAEAGWVQALDFAKGDGEGQLRRFEAETIIWAAPRFLLRAVAREDPAAAAAAQLSYAPWLVANLELDDAPSGFGAPLSWDNVGTEQDDLGYVVAGHGHARVPGDPVTITFYQAFAVPDAELARARAELLAGDAGHWERHVLGRLGKLHAELPASVRRIDLHRWGHAMIRPTPGLSFGGPLSELRRPFGRVMPCSTDLSGVPLFEEAFYAGREAAQWALARRAGSTSSATSASSSILTP